MLQLVPVPRPAPNAVPSDTLTLGERLRGDTAWVQQVTSPASVVDSLQTSVLGRVADPALWIGLLGVALRIALVLVVAHTLVSLIARGARRYTERFAPLDTSHPRRQRVTTIANLVVSAARYVVWPMAVITILGEVGVNVAALLATAGIAGLAIGFGAQTLVRDVISGFFLLFDDSLHVGDTVRIGTDEGTVEHLGVRLLKVRKFSGELLMVPAGELRIFGNRSIGFARAVVDVAVPYDRPVASVLQTMRRVADAWADANPGLVLGDRPEVHALTDLGADAAHARIVARVAPGAQAAVERDLRLALVDALALDGHPMRGPRALDVATGTSAAPLAGTPDAAVPFATAPAATGASSTEASSDAASSDAAPSALPSSAPATSTGDVTATDASPRPRPDRAGR